MLEALLLILAAVPANGLEVEFLDPKPAPGDEGRIYPAAGSGVALRVLFDGEPARGARLEAVYRPGSPVQAEEDAALSRVAFVRFIEVQIQHGRKARETKTVLVGTTRDDGTIEWSPELAGLVNLVVTLERQGEEGVKVHTVTKTISVRFESFPWLGLVVMLFAGILLLGGLVFSFRKLTSPPPVE